MSDIEWEPNLDTLRDWARGASKEGLIQALIRVATNGEKQVAVERERCAKIADHYCSDHAEWIAARIRSGQ